MASGDLYGAKGTDKHCRACTDFKTWAKLQEKTLANEKTSEIKENTEPTVQQRKECPLTKDALGSHTWNFLHTMAAYYPESPSVKEKKEMKQFFTLFSRFYPCNYCAEDLQKQLEESPPQTNSREALSQWLCRIHNNINLRLEKPLFDCSKVDERWRTGWKDGSCD